MVRWKFKDNLGDYEVIIIDRKSADGMSSIPFSSIEQVDNNYLYLASGDVIPIHRVIMIRRKSDNSTVWSR